MGKPAHAPRTTLTRALSDISSNPAEITATVVAVAIFAAAGVTIFSEDARQTVVGQTSPDDVVVAERVDGRIISRDDAAAFIEDPGSFSRPSQGAELTAQGNASAADRPGTSDQPATSPETSEPATTDLMGMGSDASSSTLLTDEEDPLDVGSESAEPPKVQGPVGSPDETLEPAEGPLLGPPAEASTEMAPLNMSEPTATVTATPSPTQTSTPELTPTDSPTTGEPKGTTSSNHGPLNTDIP